LKVSLSDMPTVQAKSGASCNYTACSHLQRTEPAAPSLRLCQPSTESAEVPSPQSQAANILRKSDLGSFVGLAWRDKRCAPAARVAVAQHKTVVSAVGALVPSHDVALRGDPASKREDGAGKINGAEVSLI